MLTHGLHPRDLHVIIPYFNPFRWESRRRLHREFMAWVTGFGATVYVVELVLGDRAFEVTSGNAHELQVRTPREVPWCKENLINMAYRKLLPKDARYMAWIDGDVIFENQNWVMDTLHELQHAPVVQMFSECMDLGPSSQAVPQERGSQDFVRHSFIKAWNNKVYHQGKKFNPADPYEHSHCGYAWAADLRFLRMVDQFNPLFDCSLVGSADWIMACCFVGMPGHAAHGQASAGYKRRVAMFAHWCNTRLQGNVSHVPGFLLHKWHGKKKDRRYLTRWQIVTEQQFDPDLDLEYRADGLLVFSGRNPKLPLLLRSHSNAKNEDSVDT